MTTNKFNEPDHALSLPRVAIGTLGGTITMTKALGGGVEPSLGADALFDEVPELSNIANINSGTLKTVPGASLTPDDILDVVRWAEEQVSQKGAGGVVIVQGTDTLEETSYLASLYWSRSEPLIFTGAMRPAHSVSSDGPANLLAACRVASEVTCRGLGTVVVMDETIHSARHVYKGHTFALNSLRSREQSMVGQVREGRVSIYSHPRQLTLDLTRHTCLNKLFVPILTTWIGDGGEALNKLMESSPRGLVLSGFGAGHVPADLARQLSEVCELIPVIYTSRVPEGPVGTGTYNFIGSEMYLQRIGALPGGTLSAPKARLLLTAVLAGNRDHANISEVIQKYTVVGSTN